MNLMLDKATDYATTRKFDVKILLNARLAPNQFHLIRQVQIATDVAKGLAARLSGQEPPKYEDNEQTLEELKARIQKTIDFLGTVKADQFNGWEKRMIAIGFMPGKALPAPEFAIQMAIPNFYFHVTTAYAILRHNGLEIGKGDYLGQLNYRDL
jgi:hypothetical protein